MRGIHKFQLDKYPGWQTIRIPGYIRYLTVGAQGNDLVLWAEVDTSSNVVVPLDVIIIWTGSGEVPDTAAYIGTTQTAEGLVHHVYVQPAHHQMTIEVVREKLGAT